MADDDFRPSPDDAARLALVNRLIDQLLADDPHDMGAGPACGCCEALSYWQEQFRLLRASASAAPEPGGEEK